MSFRNRLYAFFAIIVVAPLAAVAIVLLSTSAGGRANEADARLAQGLRTAFALYDDARSAARPALARVAADPQLRRALGGPGPVAAKGRIAVLADAVPGVRAIALYDRAGRPVATGGAADAVAPALAAPTGPNGQRIGTLAVSVTAAGDLARRLRRLTGLDVEIERKGAVLASTPPGAVRLRAPSGDVDAGGRSYRARYADVSEPVGPGVRIALLRPMGRAGGALGQSRAVLAGALLGLLLLVIAAAGAIAWTLQRQIRQLLDAARRLRHGDFSRHVAVTGDDSFAALGAEFNEMSEELAAKVEEVERRRREMQDTLRRVGDAFAAGLDRAGIVDLAVRTAVEACTADGGRAVPIDAQKMGEASVGRRDRDLLEALQAAERQAFEISPEDARELLGPLEAADAEPVERRRGATHVEVDGVRALAAPLRARVGAHSDFQHVGVVSIARRGGEFSETERDLFAYLAGQAAVSIENAHLHERVQQQAVTDELTGLSNVRHFHVVLDSEIERSRRFGTDVGLAMVDIDDFKRINDTYGHQQGDLVLVEVARTLDDLSRDIDEPARYGGEEMAVVLPQTNLDGAEGLAARMRAAIAGLEIRRVDGRGFLTVTASFGVAALPESAHDAQSLIAAADAALYRAKRAGKNRVERAEGAAAAR